MYKGVVNEYGDMVDELCTGSCFALEVVVAIILVVVVVVMDVVTAVVMVMLDVVVAMSDISMVIDELWCRDSLWRMLLGGQIKGSTSLTPPTLPLSQSFLHSSCSRYTAKTLLPRCEISADQATPTSLAISGPR